ncbi:MAG: hypothetical protein KDJ71_13820 [Nitrobacter sp.]|nr:hypothetical protein [Nitrobacter sp.]
MSTLFQPVTRGRDDLRSEMLRVPQHDGLSGQLGHIPLKEHGKAVRAFLAECPVFQSLDFPHAGDLLACAREAGRLLPFIGQNLLERVKKSC